jgi:hypothetical protein
METRCRWFCNLEDVKYHRADSVLWCRQGHEGGPLIFPAGYTPTGLFSRIGTMESLAQEMQQALATDRSLLRSLRDCGAIAVHAHLSEGGTSYNFRPVHAISAFSA